MGNLATTFPFHFLDDHPNPRMNTRPAIESSTTPGALSVSFNQDSSCFAVGLENGFSSMFAILTGHTEALTNGIVYRTDPCKLHVMRGVSYCTSQVKINTNPRRFQRWYCCCWHARSNKLCRSCRRRQKAEICS